MEYPEVSLSRWINLPYNVIVSFPLGFSIRSVLSNIFDAEKDYIFIVDEYIEDLNYGIRGTQGRRKKIYTIEDLPDKVPLTTTIIVFANIFNPIDLIRFSENKLIFVLEYGFTTELLEEIERLYKPFIYGTFVARTYTPVNTLKIIEVEIPDFTLEYDELDEKILRARCNFDYLPEWEDKEDQPKNKGGWMSEDLLSEIYQNGPKLQSIVDYLAKTTKNCVIFTTYSSEYGAYLVANTLRLEKFDILLTTDNGTDKSREKTWNQFNEVPNKRKILVTNVIPELLLEEVSSVIFFDSSSVETRRRLLKRCSGNPDILATQARVEDLITEDVKENWLFIDYQRNSKEAFDESFSDFFSN